MNTSYNYADFIGMNIAPSEFYHSDNSPQDIDSTQKGDISPMEERIENMLLNHSKYYIYCE